MITFFKAALRNIRQTGSIVESSAYLTDKMTDILDFRKPLKIVEVGAGTGKMTRSLLKKMCGQSSLTSFEIDAMLFNRLRENGDRRLKAIHADVALLGNHCQAQSADYIISGLPLTNIPAGKKKLILDACSQVLIPGGYFIQFQYSRNDFRLLEQIFAKVDLGFTLLNLPPAFIYYAQKAS